jgi:hypothetical protein
VVQYEKHKRSILPRHNRFCFSLIVLSSHNTRYSSRRTPANMNNTVDSKSYGDSPEVEATGGISPAEHAYDLDEKAKIADYKADAVEAENAEHKMTVLEAVREYPMASFWAFIMSFTIVSCIPPFPLSNRLFLSSDEES